MAHREISPRLTALVIILLIGLMSGCASHLADRRPPGHVSLTILFFNDLHGHLKPFEIKDEQGTREVGGIAHMAALVRAIREENARKNTRTVVLVAGDLLQGTPLSTVFTGEPDITCLNIMGVDAAAVGNHEFDFGFENFLKLEEMADFPFVSANIVRKDTGGLLCRPYKTIEIDSTVALTVIGVTTEELLSTTKRENVESLAVLDPVAAVRGVYNQQRPRGPVVLLSHSRHQTDRDIASAVPGLTAVIGGHDQVLLAPYRQVGAVPIFQAFEKGRYLGRIDLEIDRSTGMTRRMRS
ncbi:MAG TPA: metallophosphatase, partial [Deltaproteobacteria bacterium]|nr:metallophosphatase [Deltaproteobacteria bacterium]